MNAKGVSDDLLRQTAGFAELAEQAAELLALACALECGTGHEEDGISNPGSARGRKGLLRRGKRII